MESPLIKAQNYHEQARRLRELAHEENNDDYRQSLAEIADRYDALARKLWDEGRAATKAEP